MPENTGQSEPKPEESKPEEPKPSTPPEVQGNEGKARGKSRYVNYQDLSKDELVAMLKRVNRRLSEANKLINEALNVLYYGNTQESGGQGQRYQRQGKGYGYRKYGYRYGYSGRNYNRQYKRRSEDEDEDVDYD
jgi:hypothetical protein